jgi:superfamily II DNA/RNA helicase
MSVDTILIKRHNHRVHPCDRSQKLDLLKHLIALHSDKEILVIANQDISALDDKIDADNVTFVADSELLEDPKVKCDMIISLDLSSNPESYAKRLNQTKTFALLLADDKDQQELYKIETMMKRTLTKEVITNFEPASYIKDREAAKDLKERQEYNRKNQEERDEKRKNAWAKQKKESKYLGKDEDGKPIFSGKTGERNHRHDGTARSDEEKRENPKYKSKKLGGSKPWDKDSQGDKKPFEKKSWDRQDSDKKPWDKNRGEKKSWDNKGEKKPWDKKHSDASRSDGDWRNKPKTETSSAPKRPAKVFKLPKQSKGD